MDFAKVLLLKPQPKGFLLEDAYSFLTSVLNGQIRDEKEEVVSLAQSISNSIPFLGRRFAILLSKHIDEKDAIDISSALRLDVRFLEDKVEMHLADYLRYKPPEKEYKLFYNPPYRGYVMLSIKKFRRVMENAFLKKMLEKEAIKYKVEELRSYLPAETKVKFSVKSHPPCIDKILRELKEGVNLPHYARWVLAVYLYNINMDKEKIIELYKHLPDFKEKVTRYHVEYIFKKQYKMPSCEKVRGYGLCVANCGVVNPLEMVVRDGNKKQKMDKGDDS